MTKQIETLVDDIYRLLDPKVETTFSKEHVTSFGINLGNHILNRLSELRNNPTLRLSNIGTECWRKLYYTINHPGEGEPLTPATRFKFLFGDILEELLLFLAKEAGHTVEGTQDKVEINGIKGHRDAIIDGRLVDVKSASTYSYKKFEANGLRDNDPFGYVDQLSSYLVASEDDPLLKEKDVASFLVVDKTLGNICLDTYPKEDIDYEKKIQDLKEMLHQPEPPEKHYEEEPEGKSGNMKLGVNCSYCDYKKKCWPEVRTFLYSHKPVFLTKVVREPKVPEVTSD